MKNYTRVLSRLYNTPLYISNSKLDILSSEIVTKLLMKETLSADVQPTEHTVVNNSVPNVGIINVFDSLVSKTGGGISGFTSYESITNQIKNIVTTGIDVLIFNIDSPGGEIAGLFPLTDLIASIPKTHGIKTATFSDGTVASAAYAIAAATQVIYATETTVLGSL